MPYLIPICLMVVDSRGFGLKIRLDFSTKVCLISPGTDLPGEWALLALGSFPGLLRQTLLEASSAFYYGRVGQNGIS